MSKKTAKQEKPLREKSQVIDDLDQLSQEIPRDDQALKDGSAKLKRLEKALKDKRAEVQRQGEETQQQVEALEEDYRHYSEQNKGLQAEKLEMQKQALAEMVSSAKESVDQAQSKVEKETQAYDEINQRVKSLKNDRFLLKEFKELEKRKAVVELLKGGTDESELDEEQQEIVEEIREGRLNLVGKRIPLKGEITELDLDLYILDKTSELDQQISGAGKNKKELERLFGNLQDKVEGQNPTPDKFLSNLVSYSTRQGEILKAIQAHGQEIESDDIEKVLDSYLKLDSVKNNGEAVGLAETLREQAQGKELTLDGFLPDLIDENEKRKETLKAIQAHGQEIDSDDIGEVLDSYLESDLVIDKEVVENLVESIKGLVKASYLTPEKLLSQDIQVAEQQKQEKSDELGALEQQVREKEQEFRQVQEAAKKWDAPYDVELEPDVQRRLDTRVRILQQKQDQARQELVAVEIDGLETNKQLALELHRLEKQVDEQRKLVKSQSDKVDQNNVKFHELTEERAQIEKDAIAKKKAVKKETGEPEQEFYLSDSPQYLRLQETIKHNKEINALKREHQLAMSSQSEELERLRAENLKLQQAQEQMQREKELREQSGVSVAEPTVEKAPKGISLFDDMMESSLEQQQSRVSGGGKSLLDELSDLPPEQLVGTVFEEEVRQARATRPEEILRLQARLAELELAQEEFTRTKENLKEIEHERDELRLEVAKEKSAKQEVEHDREEELDQLRETLEQRESALEVQTREKEKLAREISEERDAHRRELSKLEQSKNLELGTLRSQLEQAAKPSETLKAVKVENEKLKAEVRRLNLDVERYQSQGQRIKDLERQLAVLKSQVEQANIEKAAKQKELELAQAELRSTKEKGDDLASKLELAQESLLQGKGDKEKLYKEVARLKDEMRRNQEEQQRQRVELEKAKKELAALEKENERVQQHVERAQQELDQIARPTKKVAREERHGQEREHSQERGRTQATVVPSTVVKVSDRVVTVSDDQILKEFRALKDRQREVIVGSGKIQGIPQGNEAFHKYASENGALIGSKLDPETAKLMNDMEREKYKEIHAKYPYKDIDWQGGKKASISKDGVELCKLSDSVPVAKEYSLNGKVINNFRSLDVPLKADGGPMHMSLAVKDLQGKNISAKEAVYLSAHYDDQGKLVEMTTPVPVYFTSQDKESPVCIKQDGRVYTLPINRGRYEEMQKQIAINKGLVVDRTTELSHDQVEVSTRPVNKARQVIEGNPEALDKLKRHSSAHHSYPPVHRNQSKGNSRLME